MKKVHEYCSQTKKTWDRDYRQEGQYCQVSMAQGSVYSSPLSIILGGLGWGLGTINPPSPDPVGPFTYPTHGPYRSLSLRPRQVPGPNFFIRFLNIFPFALNPNNFIVLSRAERRKTKLWRHPQMQDWNDKIPSWATISLTVISTSKKHNATRFSL